eukprot:CAMPEP_0178518470 /NCGR_PEP_ID=MMETSP0696-20121128/26281_1 /TAXON_ID=265572 /ORGANISM="Extubocellulus spinifer, Strain CCMP396" /LENGTH=303 /DNA_ID=CAMNT_0020149049 /DNA_START=33 /DNA_END=944 /DNA_ORIENTATION=-
MVCSCSSVALSRISRSCNAIVAAASNRLLVPRVLCSTLETATNTANSFRSITTVHGFNSSTIGPRNFPFIPPEVLSSSGQDGVAKPKLILISGCTGTGKSTFGMSVALDQGILRCVSTDTIRSVMRSFIGKEISPALHRSSYSPSHPPPDNIDDGTTADIEDDPVTSWRETCDVLAASVEGLVDDAISRNVSLVVEGVHVVPSTELVERWEDAGGVGVGCLLTIKDEEAHRALLKKRGDITGRGEVKKIEAFDRVRSIQDEMVRLATESDWMLVKQRLEPDPLELVAAELWTKQKTERGSAVE